MASVYAAFADLLTYPEADYHARIDAAARIAPSECRKYIEQFRDLVSGVDTVALQELFTHTFDLNPVCSLELGWHLFGENYERGLLLVRVRGELRRYGVEESTELPDHLTHVLRLVARLESERAADFTGACVLPAVSKMLAALRGKNNPFENILEAIQAFLHLQFPEIPPLGESSGSLLRVLA